MRVVERIAEHYDAQEVEFGRVYRWCPERVVVECDCGKRTAFEKSALIDSVKVCECGADHTAVVREWLAVRRKEEVARPWRYYYSEEDDTGLPC